MSYNKNSFKKQSSEENQIILKERKLMAYVSISFWGFLVGFFIF